MGNVAYTVLIAAELSVAYILFKAETGFMSIFGWIVAAAWTIVEWFESAFIKRHIRNIKVVASSIKDDEEKQDKS